MNTIEIPDLRTENIFTEEELQEINNYNINTYNPTAGLNPTTKKRVILIDGSNVAYR